MPTCFLHVENLNVYDGKIKRCRLDECAVGLLLSEPGGRAVSYTTDGDGVVSETPLLCSSLYGSALIDLSHDNKRPVKVRTKVTWDGAGEGAAGQLGLLDAYMIWK